MRSGADHAGNRGLDDTDVRILRLLEANGRASYEEIARYVHLSANAVRGRVQALTRGGVIRGIHADVDWGGGRKIEALIDIRLRPGADDAAFERAAVALPGAVMIEHLAGPLHYQLRAAVATTEALDELIRQVKEELDADANTKIVTRTLRAGAHADTLARLLRLEGDLPGERRKLPVVARPGSGRPPLYIAGQGCVSTIRRRPSPLSTGDSDPGYGAFMEPSGRQDLLSARERVDRPRHGRTPGAGRLDSVDASKAAPARAGAAAGTSGRPRYGTAHVGFGLPRRSFCGLESERRRTENPRLHQVLRGKAGRDLGVIEHHVPPVGHRRDLRGSATRYFAADR
jgi:Lrp/AsnC family leucine-responsive transcriptional regulator